MEQVQRIRDMEEKLNRAGRALAALEEALEGCRAADGAVAELEAYYYSPLWRQDFEDDCAGKLPRDLRRGVLSEDGIYNLLTGWDSLRKQLGPLWEP